MPFKKGNQLWKQGIKAKEANKDRLTEFFGVVANGGVAKYGEKLGELAEGAELTKSELEFMDRFEKLFEYIRPKLARTEHTGEGGGPIQITPMIYGKQDSSAVQVHAEELSD
jgi:hypothetical protein